MMSLPEGWQPEVHPHDFDNTTPSGLVRYENKTSLSLIAHTRSQLFVVPNRGRNTIRDDVARIATGLQFGNKSSFS
jgi:hypothetical protein